MNNQTIAGYRVVRTVAESARAYTLLAQPAEPAAEGVEPIVLTVYRSGVSSASVHAECDAMTRIASEHLTAVDDIASASDGGVVVVSEWIPGITLGKLLRTRTYLTAGEAITILVPLVDTLASLHRHGVIHGNFGPECVIFRSSGSPVITGLGGAIRTQPMRAPVEISNDAEVRLDVDALLRVTAGVLAAIRADRSDPSRLSQCERALQSPGLAASANWSTELERQLFSLGAPEPVRLAENVATEDSPDSPSSEVFRRPENGASESTEPTRNPTSILGLPAWLQTELERAIRTVRSCSQILHRRLAAWVAPVRPRVWVLGALAIVAIIAATMVLLSSTSASESSSSAETRARTAVPSSSGNPTSAAPRGHPQTNVDPNLAVRELLATRERCFRDLSIECLRSVENEDSPAFVADANEISRVLDGGELDDGMLFGLDQVISSQSLGDSVMFSINSVLNDQPASILLVKGEAGWRIRSYTLPE
ncbi:serine/threonine protein kinase [Salinibacterium sp. PAMC 21357]|uniref:serine/threonine protein kinase n=1 Tax=Salinibacterium sp. PAMC 21357 TaxID=1112215 RepID=UPI000288E4F8|nr:serine/threonine protein kinase [Salinibacterium sp. PAMC 21357]